MAAPTSQEIDLLTKFRDRLADFRFDNEKETQMFLLRFLRARNHNLTKAEDMIRKHMEWKKMNKIDSLLDWSPPRLLLEEYQYEVAGFDKQGCPIFVVPFGTWDVRNVCEKGLKQDYVRYVDQLFLHVNRAMEESSRIRGDSITQFVVVMVPDEFQAFRQMSSAQAVDTVLETVRRYEQNNPETLKAAFVVDAPKVFNLIFNVIKPLLNSTTLGKVTISSNEKEWKSALLKLIDEDQLCPRLGGTRPSKVPILNAPRGQYTRTRRENYSVEDSDGFVSVTIGAGQTFKLCQDVDDPNSQICWTFKTDNHDIGFSIVSSDSDEVLLPYSRVNSHLETHVGAIKCELPGKYTLVFDNTFSRFRSKVLRYKVSVESHSYETDNNGNAGHSTCSNGKGSAGAAKTDNTTNNAGGNGNNSDIESTSL